MVLLRRNKQAILFRLGGSVFDWYHIVDCLRLGACFLNKANTYNLGCHAGDFVRNPVLADFGKIGKAR